MKQAFGAFGKASALSTLVALSFCTFAMGEDKTFNADYNDSWGNGTQEKYDGGKIAIAPKVRVDSGKNYGISVRDNNTIDIYGTLANNASSGSSPMHTGPNLLEVRTGNHVVIHSGGKLMMNGTSGNGESFNPHGQGNTIIVQEGGAVHSSASANAIWFQNSYTGGTTAKNQVINYGVIGRDSYSLTESHQVMGASSGAGIDFTNHDTGRVYGSLMFRSDDNHLTLHGGSLITGTINADKQYDKNIVTLKGSAAKEEGYLNNSVTNFSHLIKEESGTWNIQKGNTLAGFKDVTVNQGTLHVDYRDTAKTGAVTRANPIRVNGGTLSVDNPNDTAVGDVTVMAGARLEGVGNVGNVASGGVIAPGHSRVPTGILRINGNYEAGQGAILEISTVLGADNSPTSRLHITGNIMSENVTLIRENNIGGHGHDTIHGIKVVQIDGKSTGHAFALDSDFTYKGVRIVHVDDYAYYLHEGDQADGSGQSYYLSAMHEDVAPAAGIHGLGAPGPVLNPGETWPTTGTGGDPGDTGGTGTGGTGGTGGSGGVVGGDRPVPAMPPKRIYGTLVPLYEALPQIMLGMNRLGGMQDRNGNRNWMALSSDPCDPCAPAGGYSSSVDAWGMWTTVEGGHEKHAPKWTTAPYDYDLNYYRAKLGFEGPLAKMGACGTLIGGVFGQYGRADSDITSAHMGFGDARLDQWGVGAYATWLGANGFYVDVQGQANWYGIELVTGSGSSSVAAGSKLADDEHGFGWAASLELGKSFGFGRGWSITPQAQIQYSKIRFNSFTGPTGDHSINYDKGDSLLGRVGFSVDKEMTFTTECGSVRKLHAYGAVNAYYDFRGETAAYTEYFSSGKQNFYRSDNSRLELGAKVGATYTWADDKYSVFAEVGVRGATKKFKDNYSVDGKVGFGVNF